MCVCVCVGVCVCVCISETNLANSCPEGMFPIQYWIIINTFKKGLMAKIYNNVLCIYKKNLENSFLKKTFE